MKIKKSFCYELPLLNMNEFPYIKRGKGANIAITVSPDGIVDIRGNSKGLLYFAQYIIAMSLIENNDGLHVHLNSETEKLDNNSVEVTIHNSDFSGVDKKA